MKDAMKSFSKSKLAASMIAMAACSGGNDGNAADRSVDSANGSTPLAK